jgi:hypothetical protein
MARPNPQFRAHLIFTFAEHGAHRRRTFGFDESGHRRVPMRMDGVDGLYTVGMWIDRAGEFRQGDEVDVDGRLIWPEGLERPHGQEFVFDCGTPDSLRTVLLSRDLRMSGRQPSFPTRRCSEPLTSSDCNWRPLWRLSLQRRRSAGVFRLWSGCAGRPGFLAQDFKTPCQGWICLFVGIWRFGHRYLGRNAASLKSLAIGH